MTLRSLALAALSGLLLAAGFPSIDLPFAPWFALIPLFLVLDGKSMKNGFWLGGLTGLVFFAGTVHWVTNSVHFYGGIPIVPASLITLLLCAVLAAFIALFGALAARLKGSHPSLFFLSAPALWTTIELLRTYLFTGFPWALLGYSQYRVLPVVQFVDITGVYGVSFLIVLVNAGLAELVRDRKRLLPAAAAGATLLLVLGYGMLRLNAQEGPESFKVAVVQGNIEQDRKWDPAYQSEVIAVYERLTKDAVKSGPDLVLWPETATPFYFGGQGKNADLTSGLRNFVRTLRTPLLTGSPTYELLPGNEVLLHNSAVLIERDGTIAATYHKMHLVPFGEYVPWKSLLFFVDKMVQAIGDFGAGNEYAVMQVRERGDGRTIPVSVVVCYEIIFPDQVRRFADRGARIITTVTNDAWFGRTAAPTQHFAMAVLRAVENRVPVARAANTGISGFIDAKGHILAASPIFTETTLTRSLAPGTDKTFYTKYGDLFSYLCCIAAGALLLIPFPKKP